MRRGVLVAALGRVGTFDHGEPAAVADLNGVGVEGLRCAYWRKRFAMPADPDPDRDRCGVVWIAPVLPMGGETVARLVARVEPEMLRHGFEPTISLRANARSIRAIIGILFDRDAPGADRRATVCRNALREILDDLCLSQYRHGLLDGAPAWDATTERLLAALKAAADPHGIIAPGRYGLA